MRTLVLAASRHTVPPGRRGWSRPASDAPRDHRRSTSRALGRVVVVASTMGVLLSAALLGCGGRGESPTEAPPVALMVIDVSPTQGSIHGGTVMTLLGNGFAQRATVTIGGVAATRVSVMDGTSMTLVTPAARTVGAADIVVTNANGESATLTNRFRYVLEDDADSCPGCWDY